MRYKTNLFILYLLVSSIFPISTLLAKNQGLIEEFKIPESVGSTHEITIGPKKNLWITQQKNSRLIRLTTDGLMTIFNLPKGAGPHGIAWDQKDRLWIGFEYKNQIAQINATGKIEKIFLLSAPEAQQFDPHGLCIGPDGKIWWTGKTSNVIGRLDPETGDVDIFPIEMENPKPIYISVGPYRNLWFTELLGNHIGRITVDGEISRYEIPFENSRPIVTFKGPKDSIWYTEENGNAYGSISQSGIFERFKTNVPDAKLAGATFDKFDNLWLQFNTPDIIQRISPNGEKFTYNLPSKGVIQHRIIVGPNGNIWFTQLKTDKIGKITVNSGKK
jgi:virginiamycin B lyase